MIVPFNKEGRCASVQSEGHITDGEIERKSTTHRRKTEKRDNECGSITQTKPVRWQGKHGCPLRGGG